MQINEKELAEAVERLREGEVVMGIGEQVIFMAMTQNLTFMTNIIYKLSNGDSAQEMFEEKFNEIARYELREAYRTKLEHEAGL